MKELGISDIDLNSSLVLSFRVVPLVQAESLRLSSTLIYENIDLSETALVKELAGPRWFSGKEFTRQCRRQVQPLSWEDHLGNGNGNHQHLCLGNPMDRE